MKIQIYTPEGCGVGKGLGLRAAVHISDGKSYQLFILELNYSPRYLHVHYKVEKFQQVADSQMNYRSYLWRDV